MPEHVASHYLSLSVEELMDDVLRHYTDNVWPLVLPIVTGQAKDVSTGGLILVGSALLPELVATLDLESVSAIWLLADPTVIEIPSKTSGCHRST